MEKGTVFVCKESRLTLLTHRASASGRALAAKVVAIVLTGAAVEARVGVTWLLGFVVKRAPAVGDGGGWGRCCGGHRCFGDGRCGGGEWLGDWCRGCSGASAVEGPAGGAWWATGNVGGGWRVPGGGGGGGSCCGDHRGSSGEEGSGGETWQNQREQQK